MASNPLETIHATSHHPRRSRPGYIVRGVMAGDWNTYGRIYVSGTGRGMLYSN